MIASDFSSSLNAAISAADFGSRLVKWGIALEAIDLIVKCGKHEGFCKWFGHPGRGEEMNLLRLKRFSNFFDSWTLGIEIVSFILVVYGLTVEISGSNEAYRISGEENATLNSKAADAWTNAAAAIRAAANSESNSIQLSWRVEVLRSNNNAVERKLFDQKWEYDELVAASLPRKLDLSEIPESIAKLRPFAGTKFFIVTLTDSEPVRLGKSIEELLVEAGWEKEPMMRYGDADDRQIPDGIWIESNGPIVGPPPSPLKPAMEALRDVLNESSISANRSFLNPWLPPSILPTNTVRIVIGLNQNWYLEDKKFQKESERYRMLNPQAK